MITIREAKLQDAPTIVQFNINLAKETEDKILDKNTVTKGVTLALENEKYGTYYVAMDGEKVVGQLMHTYEWSDWRAGVFLWIQSVYVQAEYRNQGIFKKLYSHVKNICDTDENVCGIRLYAENNNHTAQATYTKLGMEKCHYDMFEYEKR